MLYYERLLCFGLYYKEAVCLHAEHLYSLELALLQVCCRVYSYARLLLLTLIIERHINKVLQNQDVAFFLM